MEDPHAMYAVRRVLEEIDSHPKGEYSGGASKKRRTMLENVIAQYDLKETIRFGQATAKEQGLTVALLTAILQKLPQQTRPVSSKKPTWTMTALWSQGVQVLPDSFLDEIEFKRSQKNGRPARNPGTSAIDLTQDYQSDSGSPEVRKTKEVAQVASGQRGPVKRTLRSVTTDSQTPDPPETEAAGTSTRPHPPGKALKRKHSDTVGEDQDSASGPSKRQATQPISQRGGGESSKTTQPTTGGAKRTGDVVQKENQKEAARTSKHEATPANPPQEGSADLNMSQSFGGGLKRKHDAAGEQDQYKSTRPSKRPTVSPITPQEASAAFTVSQPLQGGPKRKHDETVENIGQDEIARPGKRQDAPSISQQGGSAASAAAQASQAGGKRKHGDTFQDVDHDEIERPAKKPASSNRPERGAPQPIPFKLTIARNIVDQRDAARRLRSIFYSITQFALRVLETSGVDAHEQTQWVRKPEPELQSLYIRIFGDQWRQRMDTLKMTGAISARESLEACVAAGVFEMVWEKPLPWPSATDWVTMMEEKHQLSFMNRVLRRRGFADGMDTVFWESLLLQVHDDAFKEEVVDPIAAELATSFYTTLGTQLGVLGVNDIPDMQKADEVYQQCIEDLTEIFSEALLLKGVLLAGPEYFSIEWVKGGVDLDLNSMNDLKRGTVGRQVAWCVGPMIRMRHEKDGEWEIVGKATVYSRLKGAGSD